jgi:hypothetical protein
LDEFSPMLPYDYHIYNKFLGELGFSLGKILGRLRWELPQPCRKCYFLLLTIVL